MRRLIPALLALAAGGAAAQEVLAPPAGTEFVMRCAGSGDSSWVFAENAGGKVRVHRAGKPEQFRLAPVWGYMLGDIYDQLGTGAGSIRMTLLRGPAEGVTRLVVGERHRFTYRWVAARGEAERSHVIRVLAQKRVPTAAFGEQEVFEVVDESSSPYHDLRREVLYAPALKMFVSFKVRNNRTKFEQSCELASLKTP